MSLKSNNCQIPAKRLPMQQHRITDTRIIISYQKQQFSSQFMRMSLAIKTHIFGRLPTLYMNFNLNIFKIIWITPGADYCFCCFVYLLFPYCKNVLQAGKNVIQQIRQSFFNHNFNGHIYTTCVLLVLLITILKNIILFHNSLLCLDVQFLM